MKAAPDNVRSYLNEIGRIPMLTAEQEITLGRKVQKLKSLLSSQEKLKVDLSCEPTREEWAEKAHSSVPTLDKDLIEGQKAKNQLVAANLRLVVSIAKKYQHRGLEFLDLIQEGNTGLILAAGNFNPKQGCKFSTFAHWWIRQAISRAIQNRSRTIRLPIHVHEKLNKIKKAHRELSISKGKTPRVSEIAQYLGKNPDDIRFYLKAAQIPFSFERELGEERDFTLGNLLKDKSPQPFELLLENEKPKRLSELFKDLNPQERKILVLYYGLNSEPQSYQKIATQFGLSRGRIRQKKTKAISKLKETWKEQTASYF